MTCINRTLRFAAGFVCVLALASLVVFAQCDGEKTRDDAVALLELAATAYCQARFWDAIALYEEGLDAGEVALCAGTFEEAGFSVRFDNLQVREDHEVGAKADRNQELYAVEQPRNQGR